MGTPRSTRGSGAVLSPRRPGAAVSPRRAVGAIVATGLAVATATIDAVAIFGNGAVALPLLVSALAAVAVGLVPPQWPEAGPGRVALGLLAAWLGWGLLSAVLSANVAVALATTVSFILVGLAALGVAGRLGSSGLMAAVAITLCGHGLAALVLAFTVDHDQFPQRLVLLELEANHLAALVALGAAAAALWALERPVRRWGAAPALIVVCVGGLVLSGSRTAPLALVGSVALALAAARRWRLLFGSLAALIAAFAVVLSTGLGSRIVSLTSRSSGELTNLSGANGRTTLWSAVLDIIAERPLVGVGLGVDRARILVMNQEASLPWNPEHTHNLILHLGLATGWVGAGLFLAGISVALWAALARRDPWTTAAVGFLLIDGVAEAMLRLPSATWLFLVGALGLGLTSPTVVPVERDGRAPIPASAAMSAGAVAMALAITLAWLNPGNLPERFRCRGITVPQTDGLLVDVNPVQGRVRAAGGEVALPAELLSGPVLVFGDNRPGLVLPDDVVRSVRCAGIGAGAVTMTVEVAVADLGGNGPARIASISTGTGWSDIDLQLGQEFDGLSIRVRTGGNERDDTVVPGVFTDHEPRHIVVVVTEDERRVWVDGALVSQTTIGPVEFESWRVDRTAILGNEVTADRPFAGSIGALQIHQGAHDPY